MGKRLILGTRPEVDPLQETSETSFSLTTSTEIRWNERTQHRTLAWPIFLSLIGLALSLYNPLIPLVFGFTVLCAVLLVPLHRAKTQGLIGGDNHWTGVSPADTSCTISTDAECLECKTPSGIIHTLGMELGDAKSALLGDVSSFVRAVDGFHGFSIVVTMRPENLQRLLDEERISDMVEKYFNAIPKGEAEAYILRHGGLWSSHVTAIGQIKEPSETDVFDSAARASVPMEKWKRSNLNALLSRISQLSIDDQANWFYATGSELAEWLVQLRSELASEVGSNIPGQFIAPIRGRPNDYRLGVTVNPDTLQLGPPVGYAHVELENGLLLCGGTEASRMRVISLLTSEILRSRKRVIIFTNNRDSLGYARLTNAAVHLELGKDFILNPVDAEIIPRSEYVPLFISSLEPVAGADLRGAAELELAVQRAVTLGNATLADVQLSSPLDDDVISSIPNNPKLPESTPSEKSKTGMEAIRSLHQGPAAKAFYGTQTAPTLRLTESDLTVIRVRLGSTSFDHFAWNIISVKLAGLKPDPNLVVILDGAENMRVRNRRFMKHDSFSERLLENLKGRGPIVLALEHPVDMAPGAIGMLKSCVSLRLREAVDIKIAADLLGLNVITTGMHTKARISPRESSFLRVMDDDTALLVHDGTETCQPIRLDPSPDLSFGPNSQMKGSQVSNFLSKENADGVLGDGSLLERVSAGNAALAVKVLKLLERYEPLTQEAVRRFIMSSGLENDPDVEAVLARLEHASMILRGHEVHSGVSYANFRITMKGSMALRQIEGREEGAIA
jgi:hypothetical protein